MGHDASKVLMGTSLSSSKEVQVFDNDPATFLAGLCVSRDSNGDLSLAKSDGMRMGVSLGKSIDDKSKTAVIREGLRIPVICNEIYAALTKAEMTFTAKAIGSGGNDISIIFADTATAGSETISVASNQITVGIEGGVSTAQQIKTAIDGDAESAALISVAIASGQESTAQAAFTEDNLEGGLSASDYVAIGAKAYIDDVSGKVNDSNESGVTVSDMTYVSGALTGIAEDGSEVAAALVDMPGGI